MRPSWNVNVPSNQRTPTAVTCRLPSSLTVHSHVVREFAPSGAGADPASSFSTTAAKSTGGEPIHLTQTDDLHFLNVPARSSPASAIRDQTRARVQALVDEPAAR
jgi:hypothetical protein